MGGQNQFRMRHRTRMRPPRPRAGQAGFFLPRTLIEDRHELALTISFITKRRAFGYAYAGIQPDYFFSMPQDSGVYVCPVVPTEILTSEIRYPGDIDLLIVPYEMDELVLDRVVAVEIKAVRASFANQGKSPNGFGVSQASGLLQMGFPYVALAHLIVIPCPGGRDSESLSKSAAD